MTGSNSKSRFVDAAFICREFNISRRTLYTWVKDGRFPQPLRLNLRRYVWLRKTFDAVIEQAELESQFTQNGKK